MFEIANVTGALAVGAAWLTKEVTSLALKELAERRGALKYLSDGRYFLQTFQADDGREYEAASWPLPDQLTDDYIRTAFFGNFVNESARPFTVTDMRVSFWGVEGCRIVHSSPGVLLNGSSGRVQTIPARCHANVRITTSVHGKELTTLYRDTIPILEVILAGDRVLEYPLHITFWGDSILRWNSKKRRVQQ